MKRFHSFFVMFFALLLIVNSAMAEDFSKVFSKISDAAKKNNGKLKLADLGYFKVLPAGLIQLENAEVFKSPSNKGLLFITARGKLPGEFKGLKNKDSKVVISVADGPAVSKESKDLLGTLTAVYDTAGIEDFYGKLGDNLFKDLLSGKAIFTHSNGNQTITADMVPAEVQQYYIPSAGKDFVLNFKDGMTMTSRVTFKTENTGPTPIRGWAELLCIDKFDVSTTFFLSPDIKHVTLRINLSDSFKPSFLPESFVSAQPYIFINPSEFGIGFDIKIKTSSEENLIQGTAQASLPVFYGKSSSPEKNSEMLETEKKADQAFAVQKISAPGKDRAILIGSLRGLWKNAFGLKGLDLYDLVIKGEIPVKAGVPVIGIGGTLDIGKVKVAFGGKIPAGARPDEIAVMGKAQEVPFGDLFALILKSCAGDAAEKSEIPLDKLSLRDLIVSISPRDDRDLNIKEGITLAGSLFLDNQMLGKVDVRTTHGKQEGPLKPLVGFRAECWIKEIKFGPVQITGKGPDGKKNTKDDGVYLDLAVGTKLSDHLKFSGLVKLFSVEQEADVAITKLSIDIFMRDRVFDLFEAEIALKGSVNPARPDFVMNAALTENFADEVVKFASEAFNDALEEMTEDLADAKENLAEASEDLEDARKDVAKGIDGFRKEAEKMAEKIEKAQKKVKKLDKSLDKKEKQLKKLKWNKFKKRAKLIAQIAGLKPALAAAKLALKGLEGMTKEKNLDKVADGLKKAADETLKLAEKAMQEASEKMADAEKLAENASPFANKIKEFSKNFAIEKAGFEMNLEQLKKSKSPELFFVANIFGKKTEGSAQCDFSDKQKALSNFVKALFEKFAEKDKQLGKAALILLESL